MIKSLLSKYAVQGSIVMILMLFSFIGFLTLHISSLEEQNSDLTEINGKLNQANNQLKQDIEDQEATIKKLRDQIALNDKINSENAEQKEKITNQNESLKNELRKLKNAKPEVKNYLDSNKPDDVVRMLKSLQRTGTAADKNNSGDSTSPGELDGANGEADSAVQHERMWRPIDNRLQYCA
jgi:peptidoglycan hydrolase CwlO-like protein